MKRIDPESHLGKLIQHGAAIAFLVALGIVLYLAAGCATRANVMGYEVAWVIGAGEIDCGDNDPAGCMRGAEVSEQAAAAATSIVSEKEARRTAEIPDD